jgi:hypothetical protein
MTEEQYYAMVWEERCAYEAQLEAENSKKVELFGEYD